MPGSPIRRGRKLLAIEKLKDALLAGLTPEHVLASLDPAIKTDIWILLLDFVLKVNHGLMRVGLELVGDCAACGGHKFSIGRKRTRCYDCNLDIDSHEYIRQQIERLDGANAALRRWL